MAVRVGDDQVAALFHALNALVVALFILGNVVAPDHVVIGQTTGGHGLADALNVSIGVALVFVTDENDADLEGVFFFRVGVGGGFIVLAAGNQGQSHDKSEKHCKELLHSDNPP